MSANNTISRPDSLRQLGFTVVSLRWASSGEP
jgi:hypothetical protein